MSPKKIPTWRTTDDEQPVAIRIAEPKKKVENVVHNVSERKNPSLGIPAFFGIAIVLVSFGWYFGLDKTLLGELQGNSNEKVITITESGEFDPKTIELVTGDTVKIVNANNDPQVLKSENGRILFETAVIVSEPFFFTVSADALGPYVYYSETLPEGQTMTFNIALPMETEQTEEQNTQGFSDPIPIPFAADDIPVIPEKQPTQAVVTVHEGGAATISVAGSSSSSASTKTDTKTRTEQQVPTNPYTVQATGAERTAAQQQTLAATNEELHGGAPLAQYANYRPPVTSATGPEHTALVVVLLSLLLFWPVARRMMKE